MRSYETMSNETKTFDWSNLSPGDYEFKGTELIAISSVGKVYDNAAENFVAALRRLHT